MLGTNQRLVAALAKARVPVTGFVITGVAAPQASDTGRRSLQLWLDAGFDLGNHSDTHPNFAETPLDQMEADVLRADAILRPLLAANHRTLQFFRYPYNSTGDTPAKHDAFAAFLRDHGYQVATCTIDTSDYLFAAAYSRAIGSHNAATAASIRREYLTYSAAEIDFYAALNRRVLGYEPPEVLLLHDSLLNADTVPQVLALFRSRGYRFVTLAEAQRDPAFAIPDTYISSSGPMWGYRWAKERALTSSRRLPGSTPVGTRQPAPKSPEPELHEPEPPSWITSYAEGKLPPREIP